MIRLRLFYQASVFFASVPQHLKMKHIHLAFRMNGFNKGSEVGNRAGVGERRREMLTAWETHQVFP